MISSKPRFEVLEGLPPYGPPAKPFPATGRATYSEGFVVRFYPSIDGPWVGNFAASLSSLCTVEEHPDGQHLVVISGGAGYIINPDNSKEVEEIDGWYSRTMRVGDLLILVTPITFEAFGPSGHHWRSRRISWDGMRNLNVDPEHHMIAGEAWTYENDAWIPFVLHLASGVAEGGSYNGPD